MKQCEYHLLYLEGHILQFINFIWKTQNINLENYTDKSSNIKSGLDIAWTPTRSLSKLQNQYISGWYYMNPNSCVALNATISVGEKITCIARLHMMSLQLLQVGWVGGLLNSIATAIFTLVCYCLSTQIFHTHLFPSCQFQPKPDISGPKLTPVIFVVCEFFILNPSWYWMIFVFCESFFILNLCWYICCLWILHTESLFPGTSAHIYMLEIIFQGLVVIEINDSDINSQ